MTQSQDEHAKHFSFNRFYVKDLSLETPGVPGVFTRQSFEPELDFSLNHVHKNIDTDVYEVVLHAAIKIRSRNEEAVLCLLELQVAGIFLVKNFVGEEQEYILEVSAPEILFPYLREVVSDVIMRATFPQLILAPINFMYLYEQKKKQAAAAQ